MSVDTFVVQKVAELVEEDLFRLDESDLRYMLVEIKAYCEFAKKLKESEAKEREEVRN